MSRRRARWRRSSPRLLLLPSRAPAAPRPVHRHPQDPARRRDHAGEPLVRLLLRHVSRAPTGSRRHVCVPDPLRRRLRAAYHDPRDRNAGGPHDHVDAVARHRRREDERLHRAAPRSGRRMFCNAAHRLARVLALAEDAGRHGLPRRARDPELLGVRAQLRAPGPHVRVGHVVEPAGAPLPRLRLVGEVHAARRPDELHDRGAGARLAAGRAARTRPASRPTTRGPTSRTSCTRTTSAGATTSSRARSPTATTTRCSARRSPQNAKTPGIWNPLPWFDTVQQDGQRENIAPFNDFFAAAHARDAAGRLVARRRRRR